MMPICLVSLRVKCSIMYMYVYVTHSNKVSSHKKPYGRDILEYSYKLALGLLVQYVFLTIPEWESICVTAFRQLCRM